MGKLVMSASRENAPWLHDLAMVSAARAYAQHFGPAPVLQLYTTQYKTVVPRRKLSEMLGLVPQSKDLHVPEQIPVEAIAAWTIWYHTEGVGRTIIIGGNGAVAITGDKIDALHIPEVPVDEIANYFGATPSRVGEHAYYDHGDTRVVAAAILGVST